MFHLDDAREKLYCTFQVVLLFSPSLLSHNISVSTIDFFILSQLLRIEVICIILKCGYSFFSAEAQSSHLANFCFPFLSCQLPSHSQRGQSLYCKSGGSSWCSSLRECLGLALYIEENHFLMKGWYLPATFTPSLPDSPLQGPSSALAWIYEILTIPSYSGRSILKLKKLVQLNCHLFRKAFSEPGPT